MSQHVAHRHSDEIHELRAEIERLQPWLNNQVDEIKRKNIEIKRLQAALQAALREVPAYIKDCDHEPAIDTINAALKGMSVFSTK